MLVCLLVKIHCWPVEIIHAHDYTYIYVDGQNPFVFSTISLGKFGNHRNTQWIRDLEEMLLKRHFAFHLITWTTILMEAFIPHFTFLK